MSTLIVLYLVIFSLENCSFPNVFYPRSIFLKDVAILQKFSESITEVQLMVPTNWRLYNTFNILFYYIKRALCLCY